MQIDKRTVEGSCYECMFYYDADTPDTCGCGECRFGPPTALPIFGRGDYNHAAFPLVSEYDWCWRFVKKVYTATYPSKKWW